MPDPDPVTMRVCAPGCEETRRGSRAVAPRGAATVLPEAAAEPDLLSALCRRRASTFMQFRVLGLMMAVRMSPTIGMSLITKSTRAQTSIAMRVGAGRPPETFLAARMSVKALMSEMMSGDRYVSEGSLVSCGLEMFSQGSSRWCACFSIPFIIATTAQSAKIVVQKETLTTHDRKQAPKGHCPELDV